MNFTVEFNFPNNLINFEPSQHMNSAKRKFQISFSFRFSGQTTPDQMPSTLMFAFHHVPPPTRKTSRNREFLEKILQTKVRNY